MNGSVGMRPRLFIAILLLSLAPGACKNDKKLPGEHKFTNALIHETSPYLLQHAYNPVDWRPWSEEAFEAAKKEQKLVIVSVGYSSCHWCHVMEEETFEDVEVARLMNEKFISIKVDREERPDVDQIYMSAVQLMTGHGGWPLNAITLPNGKPVYGGTYHSKADWIKVLGNISDLYSNDPEKAEEYANMVARGIREVNLVTPPQKIEGPQKEDLKVSVAQWKPHWDSEWGGNKGMQKFMIPGNQVFLMDYGTLVKDDSAISFVKTTLDKMALGGIYDHLGGGFFRYSTDPYWKVPHFEKMLYDNAQLIGMYSKAYSLFKDPKYKRIVYETFEFLEREMKDSAGGYFAAIDADSEGEEGKFYIWDEQELKTIAAGDYDLFSSYFNTSPDKVWEDGKYVLYKTMEDEAFAKVNKMTPEALGARVQAWKESFLNERNKRVKPRVDDKIITSWNALLMAGLVDAYGAFGDPKFLDAAEDVYHSLVKSSYRNKHLVHSYKKGSKRSEGFLEDYAFLANASLSLYSATMDKAYFHFAQELMHTVQKEYKDGNSVFFRYNRNDALIAKIFKTDDGVLPSANAVLAHNFFILGHLEYNKEYLENSRQMLSVILPSLKANPDGYSRWASLLLNEAYAFYEIAVVGTEAAALVRDLKGQYLPNTLVVGSEEESDLPLFKNRFLVDETLIYVCRNNACKLPVATVDGAMGQLQNF